MRTIKKLNPSDFDTVYSILEESFPPDERRTYEGQRALLCNPKYCIYTFCEGEEVLAFMAIWDLLDLAFVEHFAVRPALRGNNIGSQMLKEIKELLNRDICLEVELPNCEIAKRRISFYMRAGMFLNEYEYIQPAMAKGRAPVPLMIMTSDSFIDRVQFERIRNDLYTEVYDLSLDENKDLKKLVYHS